MDRNVRAGSVVLLGTIPIPVPLEDASGASKPCWEDDLCGDRISGILDPGASVGQAEQVVIEAFLTLDPGVGVVAQPELVPTVVARRNLDRDGNRCTGVVRFHDDATFKFA